MVHVSVVNMSMNILPGSDETLDSMKGQTFRPHKGEGIVYLKLVMIKPETMQDGDPKKLIEESQGVILCGQLDAMEKQISRWFKESAEEYNE